MYVDFLVISVIMGTQVRVVSGALVRRMLVWTLSG